MQVLITGGSGFIGKNLKEYFEGKHQVFAPSHRDLDLGDRAAVSAFLRDHSIDVVIHAASQGVSRKQQRAQTDIIAHNVGMAENLLWEADRYQKIFLFGSGAEYGKQRDLACISEQAWGEVEPADDYGKSKYRISQLAATVPNAVVLRPFSVYGKYEDYATRFISNCLCRAISDIPIVIHQDVKFDFLYINDLVRIVEYLLTHETRFAAYNLGSGQPRTLTSVVGSIEQQLGRQLKVTVKQPGMNWEYTCDISRLRAELPPNFTYTSFDTSLRELYDWYAAHEADIDHDLLMFDR